MNKRIVILKFDKYNPRKDRKRHSWFRVDNTIFLDLDLPPEQSWFWITLVAQASVKQRDWLPFNLEKLAKNANVSIETAKQAMDFFLSSESGDSGQPMAALMTEKEYAEHNDAKAQEISGNQSVTSRLPIGVPTDIQTYDTYDTNEVRSSSTILNTTDAQIDSEIESLLLILSKNSAIKEVLSELDRSTLEFLLIYDSNWLIGSMLNAISHIKKKQNVLKPSQIKNLDSGIIGWFRNEKKPRYSNSYSNLIAFKDHSELKNAKVSGDGHES